MCDCAVPLTRTKWAKKCRKKHQRAAAAQCAIPEGAPRIMTMVKWSPPVLLENRNSQGRIPRPHGGYHRLIPAPGFPYKPKIPGLLGPPFIPEDIQITPQELSQILNVLFPPIVWEENDRIWKQEVSPLPARRQEVEDLAEELQVTLLRSQARKGGICPIRQYLFFQCFDEVIRQVTVNCAERGLLLRQVKEELQLLMKIYQTLVESAIQFGTSKFEEITEVEEELKAEYEELVKVKRNLEWEHEECKLQMVAAARTHKDRKKYLTTTRNMKLAYIQRSNDQFFYMLDNIGADKKYYFHLM